jgi:hypothetical protein
MTYELRKAAEMALRDLTLLCHAQAYDTVETLRQALAQSEQEPVAWIMEMPPPSGADRSVRMTSCKEVTQDWENAIPLYTAPPNKEWVGLTDEERFLNDCRSPEEIEYAKAIEAKLKEKNT